MTNGILNSLPEGVLLDTTTLRTDHYLDDVSPKKMVMLHQTQGASVKSSFEWLETEYTKVMTAFFVERDGKVYQTFPCDRWAYHLGKGVATARSRESVAIEIANMGPLRVQDGKLYTQYNMKTPFCSLTDTDRYVAVAPYYRDFGYYEKTPAIQLKAVRVLVHALCEAFNIPKVFIDDPWRFNPSYAFAKFTGVAHHGKFRADKNDINPTFPMGGMQLSGSWKWPV